MCYLPGPLLATATLWPASLLAANARRCWTSVISSGKELQSPRGGLMVEGAGETGDVKKPQPDEKLVRVFDAEQESEVLVVRGLLESQGIDADITSLDAQQDILPGVGGTIILVREEDAAKARQVIEEYRQAPSEIEIDEGG
jgi:Putative prokaryotic signal transducing protein